MAIPTSDFIKLMNAIEDQACLGPLQSDLAQAQYTKLVGAVKSSLIAPYEAVVVFRNYIKVLSYANQH